MATEDILRELNIPEVKSFSEVRQNQTLWDVTHSDVLDKTIIVIEYEEIETAYGTSLRAKCIVDGELKYVLIGSTVLQKQLVENKDYLPFECTITRPANYYSFK